MRVYMPHIRHTYSLLHRSYMSFTSLALEMADKHSVESMQCWYIWPTLPLLNFNSRSSIEVKGLLVSRNPYVSSLVISTFTKFVCLLLNLLNYVKTWSVVWTSSEILASKLVVYHLSHLETQGIAGKQNPALYTSSATTGLFPSLL